MQVHKVTQAKGLCTSSVSRLSSLRLGRGEWTALGPETGPAEATHYRRSERMGSTYPSSIPKDIYVFFNHFQVIEANLAERTLLRMHSGGAALWS